MQSKNKRAPNLAESEHIRRVKDMPCSVCDQPGPSDAHEIKQGQWFTAIPLCKDCHQGSHNGIHGRKHAWSIRKLDEIDALAITIERLLT